MIRISTLIEWLLLVIHPVTYRFHKNSLTTRVKFVQLPLSRNSINSYKKILDYRDLDLSNRLLLVHSSEKFHKNSSTFSSYPVERQTKAKTYSLLGGGNKLQNAFVVITAF